MQVQFEIFCLINYFFNSTQNNFFKELVNDETVDFKATTITKQGEEPILHHKLDSVV